MNFLNPWYLLAALAAVVPIIIHLLHRQRARIEIFPSLEFLRRMMRTRSRRFRIKQILLLVVRTLLVLLVALALARPTLTRGRAVRGHLPTAAAVILDDSFSMSRVAEGGTLFDVALEKTREVLRYFDQGDEVYLLTASSVSRDLSEAWGTRDAARLRQRLGEVSATHLATDMARPLEAAIALVDESANPNKEIYLISDMQKAGWERIEGPLGNQESSGRVLVVDLGQAEANTCVADASLRIPSGSDDLELQVTFEAYNSSGSQGRVAEVFLKGDLLARSVFSPGETGRERETFRLPAFRGFSWGEVALAEDRLPVDDKRYFAIPSRQRVVGLVGDTYYISRALSPEGGGSLTLVEIAEGAVSRAGLVGVDVLVISDVARFSPLEVEALADYVAAGGGLLVFLGGRVDVGDYNRNLLPRLVAAAAAGVADSPGSVRIEGASVGGAGGPANRGFFDAERFDRSHPIFAKFKPDESPFGDVRFYAYTKIQADAGRTLAYFSDGSPALLELGDRVMILASSADVSWNDLVLAPQFVPILHETILHLASQAIPGSDYKVGADITVTAGGRPLEASLDGPGGSMRLFPEAISGGTRYRIESPAEPGVYFLRTGAETLAVFAVNVDSRESDLTKIAAADVAALLRPLEVRQVTAPDDVGESISLMRTGRDLSRTMLWAALGLLLVETLLASTLSLGLSRTEGQDALSDS